ncbi:hypothetical protein COOONC_19437 [Cooperia oncophora]
MFTPLKRRDTKDGFFVQWVECSVVLIVHFAFLLTSSETSRFEWIALPFGGLLYATGNVFSVPIVNGLGMGIGFLIWGTMQVRVVWSVARFGLFGLLAPTEMKHNLLNYIGLAITLVSGVLFIFVKHAEDEKRESASTPNEHTELKAKRANSAKTTSSKTSVSNEEHNSSSNEVAAPGADSVKDVSHPTSMEDID